MTTGDRRRQTTWRVAVFAGGVVGTLVRLAAHELEGSGTTQWPWSTLGVNLAGAFALGALVIHAARKGWAPAIVALVGVGFLGALTTFSAVAVEVWRLADAGREAVAVAYAATSVVAGLACAVLGAGAVMRR